MEKVKWFFLQIHRNCSMMDSGIMVLCMVKVFFNGMTHQNMKESLLMAKNRAKESSHLLMEIIMKDIGYKGNKMVLESYLTVIKMSLK
jgi:hypothetical protein